MTVGKALKDWYEYRHDAVTKRVRPTGFKPMSGDRESGSPYLLGYEIVAKARLNIMAPRLDEAWVDHFLEGGTPQTFRDEIKSWDLRLRLEIAEVMKSEDFAMRIAGSKEFETV